MFAVCKRMHDADMCKRNNTSVIELLNCIAQLLWALKHCDTSNTGTLYTTLYDTLKTCEIFTLFVLAVCANFCNCIVARVALSRNASDVSPTTLNSDSLQQKQDTDLMPCENTADVNRPL